MNFDNLYVTLALIFGVIGFMAGVVTLGLVLFLFGGCGVI